MPCGAPSPPTETARARSLRRRRRTAAAQAGTARHVSWPTARRSHPWSRRRPRRWGATSRAGAGAARSSSCAMARPEPAGGDARDLTGELAALRKRLGEAEGYLSGDTLRARLAELEQAVSRPDLWDDPDEARRVTSEYAAVNDDVTMLDNLAVTLRDAEELHELMVESGDDSVAGDLVT